MQVMLDGRRFPPAEASSKKVAKKVAAAETLRALQREMEGTTGIENEAEQPAVPLAELNDFAEDCFVRVFFLCGLIYITDDMLELSGFFLCTIVSCALSFFPLFPLCVFFCLLYS